LLKFKPDTSELTDVMKRDSKDELYVKIMSVVGSQTLNFIGEDGYSLLRGGRILGGTAFLDKIDTQYNRRMYIRAVFSAIEGTCFTFRADIINDVESKKYHISLADKAMLREESYSFDKENIKGRANTRYISLDNMLLFTFKHLAASNAISYEIDKKTDGWRSFKQALKARNRITHPRNPDEFQVSDSDLVDIKRTYKWFWLIYRDVHKIKSE